MSFQKACIGKGLKHAKHASDRKVSQSAQRPSTRDYAQNCIMVQVLGFVQGKRKSHLRVILKEILDFFSFFFPQFLRIKEKSKQLFSFLSTTSFKPQNFRWILKSHILMSSIKLFFPSKKVTLIGRESSFFQRKDLLWKSNRWESLTWRYSTFPNKNFKCLLNRNEVLTNKITSLSPLWRLSQSISKYSTLTFCKKNVGWCRWWNFQFRSENEHCWVFRSIEQYRLTSFGMQSHNFRCNTRILKQTCMLFSFSRLLENDIFHLQVQCLLQYGHHTFQTFLLCAIGPYLFAN